MAGADDALCRTIIYPVIFQSPDDEALIRDTIHEYNEACQLPADALWPARGPNTDYTDQAVQSTTYDTVREQTRLGSQHAILATHQAAQALRGVRERRTIDILLRLKAEESRG